MGRWLNYFFYTSCYLYKFSSITKFCFLCGKLHTTCDKWRLKQISFPKELLCVIPVIYHNESLRNQKLAATTLTYNPMTLLDFFFWRDNYTSASVPPKSWVFWRVRKLHLKIPLFSICYTILYEQIVSLSSKGYCYNKKTCYNKPPYRYIINITYISYNAHSGIKKIRKCNKYCISSNTWKLKLKWGAGMVSRNGQTLFSKFLYNISLWLYFQIFQNGTCKVT